MGSICHLDWYILFNLHLLDVVVKAYCVGGNIQDFVLHKEASQAGLSNVAIPKKYRLERLRSVHMDPIQFHLERKRCKIKDEKKCEVCSGSSS